MKAFTGHRLHLPGDNSRDNDTTGAIVGAAVGALHGRKALPDRWLRAHTGRTRRDDDGRIPQLIEEARMRWWLPPS